MECSLITARPSLYKCKGCFNLNVVISVAELEAIDVVITVAELEAIENGI